MDDSLHFRAVVPRLVRLSPGEWRDLFAAQWSLIRAAVAVKVRPLGTLASSSAPQAAARSTGERHVVQRANELATALQRVASHGPLRPMCLVRSLALRSLLTANGITHSVIRVGVMRQDGALLAHAWVELDGSVIGDDERYVTRFAQLPGLELEKSVWTR